MRIVIELEGFPAEEALVQQVQVTGAARGRISDLPDIDAGAARVTDLGATAEQLFGPRMPSGPGSADIDAGYAAAPPAINSGEEDET